MNKTILKNEWARFAEFLANDEDAQEFFRDYMRVKTEEYLRCVSALDLDAGNLTDNFMDDLLEMGCFY